VSLRVFAKKIGLSSSHLQRIESGEQNVSLDTLEMVLDRLKVTLRDVFKG
jgi:transcriptional regulator with XRE-family HTH domain